MNSSLVQQRGSLLQQSIVAILLFAFTFAVIAAPASAQSFNTDARLIGMGGSDQSNDATGLMEDSKEYKSIGLPLGLFQLWKHKDAFDPNSAKFNPLLVIEDLASPLHYTFGRDSETQGNQIIQDLRNGKITKDLGSYRGFVPKSPVIAQGIFSPSFGHTFKFHGKNKAFQGIYIGAGPYLTASTNFAIDQNLLNSWAGTGSIPANSVLKLDDTTVGQAAAQITGGYRARFATPKGLESRKKTNRDGVYVSVNYHYIRGFHYDADIMAVRLPTDANGQLITDVNGAINSSTITSNLTALNQQPVFIDRVTSKHGTGRAVDVGTVIVTGPWEVNFGADGIGNRIEWTDLAEETLSEAISVSVQSNSVVASQSFTITKLPAPTPNSVTIELPVRYSAGATYRAKRWTVRGQFVRSANVSVTDKGREFHFGGEYRLGPLALRGGYRYSRKNWNPMGGAGISITKHFGIDAAVFSSTANAQADHRTAVALSLRFQS